MLARSSNVGPCRRTSNDALITRSTRAPTTAPTVRAHHMELRDTYGIMWAKRVERLMRRAGLPGIQKRRFRCTTRSGLPSGCTRIW